MLPRALRLLQLAGATLISLVAANLVRGESAASNVAGFWVGDCPGLGEVGIAPNNAPSVYPIGPHSRKGNLLWATMDLEITWVPEENGIAIYKELNYSQTPTELDFRLQYAPDGGMVFVEGGLITKGRLAFLKSVEIRKSPDEWPNSRRKAKPPLFAAAPDPLADLSLLLAVPEDGPVLGLLKARKFSAPVLDEVGDRILKADRGSRFGISRNYLLEALAGNSGSSPELLERIIALNGLRFTLPASFNPNARFGRRAAALKLLQESRAARGTAAECRYLDHEAWQAALAEKEDFVVDRFVQNPKAPTDLLAGLIGRNDSRWLPFILQNPSAPMQVLCPMANTEDWRKVELLRNNPAVPETTLQTILRKMAKLPDANERRDVVRHERTAPELLSGLAGDPDVFVRDLVADNANTPEATLLQLVNDRYAQVADTARMNINNRFHDDGMRLYSTWTPMGQLDPTDLNKIPRVDQIDK